MLNFLAHADSCGALTDPARVDRGVCIVLHTCCWRPALVLWSKAACDWDWRVLASVTPFHARQPCKGRAMLSRGTVLGFFFWCYSLSTANSTGSCSSAQEHIYWNLSPNFAGSKLTSAPRQYT